MLSRGKRIVPLNTVDELIPFLRVGGTPAKSYHMLLQSFLCIFLLYSGNISIILGDLPFDCAAIKNCIQMKIFDCTKHGIEFDYNIKLLCQEASSKLTFIEATSSTFDQYSD